MVIAADPVFARDGRGDCCQLNRGIMFYIVSLVFFRISPKSTNKVLDVTQERIRVKQNKS